VVLVSIARRGAASGMIRPASFAAYAPLTNSSAGPSS